VGVAVFFGMLGVTMFGLSFTPIFYVWCETSPTGPAQEPAAAQSACTGEFRRRFPLPFGPNGNRWEGTGLFTIVRAYFLNRNGWS
jgi:hypothetical protein